MKKGLLIWIFFGISNFSNAQIDDDLLSSITLPETEFHLRFLSSDEFMGRHTHSPEINIAGRYIAELFRSYGIKPANADTSYLQEVKLLTTTPSNKGKVSSDNLNLKEGIDFIVMNNVPLNYIGEVVFAGFGQPGDFENLDVKGKLVITKTGSHEGQGPRQYRRTGREKMALAKEKGAAGLIELYNSKVIPWNILLNYLNSKQYALEENADIADKLPYIWINDPAGKYKQKFEGGEGKSLTVAIPSPHSSYISSYNIAGIIEGTDPELRDEYLLLSAHYDHVGTGKAVNGDSIYNGARDNGIGTVALISAAKYLADNPPRRSVLLLALTGEELGLLGSKWYVEHPLVSLQKTIFNLNTDGAGYNDTTMATIIGLGRTTAEDLIIKGLGEFGLKAAGDPAPEQNLYNRSDNASFAVHGIPSINMAPGISGFDRALLQHYHQPSDEAENLNFHYLLTFYRAYAYVSALIANLDQTPYWKNGDEYEEAGNELYGK